MKKKKTLLGYDIKENGNELFHYGIKGQKWGVRRYQNEDGTLTEAGKQRYFGSGKGLKTAAAIAGTAAAIGAGAYLLNKNKQKSKVKPFTNEELKEMGMEPFEYDKFEFDEFKLNEPLQKTSKRAKSNLQEVKKLQNTLNDMKKREKKLSKERAANKKEISKLSRESDKLKDDAVKLTLNAMKNKKMKFDENSKEWKRLEKFLDSNKTLIF